MSTGFVMKCHAVTSPCSFCGYICGLYSFPLLKENHSSLPSIPFQPLPLRLTLSHSFPHLDINKSVFFPLHPPPSHSIQLLPTPTKTKLLHSTPFHSVPFLPIPDPQFIHEKNSGRLCPFLFFACTSNKGYQKLRFFWGGGSCCDVFIIFHRLSRRQHTTNSH